LISAGDRHQRCVKKTERELDFGDDRNSSLDRLLQQRIHLWNTGTGNHVVDGVKPSGFFAAEAVIDPEPL
jgi:hypothetical protein